MTQRLAILSLAGSIGAFSACSLVLDLDGYGVSRNDAGVDFADAAELPAGPAVASFDNYYFTRGTAAAFYVPPAEGPLANDTGENVRISAGTQTTHWGGQVELSPDGGFRYTPPGAVATFWGDDYFDYDLLSEPPAGARVRLTLQPPALSLGELAAARGGGFGIAGARAQDAIGTHPQSFAAAGDVNGDGLEDFVIGVLGPATAPPIPIGAGRGAYVVFGKADVNNLSLANLDGETPHGFAILGDDDSGALDSLGYVVAGAGDVNADGFDDIVVGSHGYALAGSTETTGALGAAYVVYGKADAESVSTAAVRSGIGGFFIRTSTPSYFVGFDVDGAGDVNGDGFDDVIVSSLVIDPEIAGSFGGAHVVFGKVGSEPVLLDRVTESREGFVIASNANDSLGIYVSGLGDVNGDGLDDLGLGTAAGSGRSYVVFGKTDSNDVAIAELEADSTRGFAIIAADANDGTGDISAGGDVDGDGLDDILVSTPAATLGRATEPSAAALSDAGPDAGDAAAPSSGSPPISVDEPAHGVVYVVFGKREPGAVSLRSLEDGVGRLGFAIGGTQLLQQIGVAASAGDINGDGASDILIAAAPSPDSNSDYIVFGKNDTRVVALSPFMPSSNEVFVVVGPSAEATGTVTATGADANGDGLDDLLVGARLYADAPQAAGGAYLAFGWDMTRALEGRDRALLGSSGDDVLELPNTPIVIARGGHGVDTLHVDAATSELDLTLRGRYESVEIFDVRAGGPHSVKLDDAALCRIPQNHVGLTFGLTRTLTVLGDADDVLRFDLRGYTRRSGSSGRVIWGRQGSYCGLQLSQGMRVELP